jgi:hypothetical protein
MFQLCDTWVESICADDYLAFLADLLDVLSGIMHACALLTVVCAAKHICTSIALVHF